MIQNHKLLQFHHILLQHYIQKYLKLKIDNGFKDRYLAGKATVRCDIYKSNGFEDTKLQ